MIERNPSVEPYYLPMDCPVCGRRRMEWDGKILSCEKCSTSSEWDGFTQDRYLERLAAGIKAAAVLRLIAGNTDQTYTPTEVSVLVTEIVDQQITVITGAETK